MKSKKIRLILGMILLVTVIGVTVFAASDRVYSIGGLIAKKVELSKDKTVAATVNGVRIYKSSVDKKLLDYEYSLNAVSNQSASNVSDAIAATDVKEVKSKVIDQLINDEIKRQQCAKLGIKVSDEEARGQMKMEFAALDGQLSSDDASTRANAQEIYDRIEKYKDAAGITDEEYEAQALEIYRDLLLSNKLYAFVLENDLIDNSEESAHDRFESYIESVKGNYDITIYKY